MKNIKVIVFDLYNTLVQIRDSKHFFLKLYKLSKNGFGLKCSEYLTLIMTKEVSELFEILPNEFKDVYVLNKPLLDQELNSVEVYNDVHFVLKDLSKSYRLVLVSNLASPYKIPVYKLGLDAYFEYMLFSCKFGALKPDKVMFRDVEKVMGVKASEILMVGDSFKADILGARNVGWNTLQLKRLNSKIEYREIDCLNRIRDYLNN